MACLGWGGTINAGGREGDGDHKDIIAHPFQEYKFYLRLIYPVGYKGEKRPAAARLPVLSSVARPMILILTLTRAGA